ncbi:MAG: type IX secretion system outer membrane channel protein PorV [Bacteroidota bacterium]
MKNLLKLFLPLLGLVLTVQAAAQTGFGCSFNVTTGEWENVSGGPCVNTIITAVPFLRIVPDARSGAMGDAGIAISPDANAMHFNASKLAFVEEDVAVSVTYTPWLRALGLQDVYMAYLSGFKQIDSRQTVGFSLRYFSLGSISFTDESGQPLGTGRPNEFEISAAYARQLSEKFSVAIAPKFIYSNLAAGQTVGNVEITPGIAAAADFSLTYKTPLNFTANKSDLTLGAAISNLGTKISYTNSINKDFIPANLGLGAAWSINFDEFNELTITTDINKLLVPTPCLAQNPEDCDADGNMVPDYKEDSAFGGAISSFGDAPGGFSEELRELMLSIGVEYWYDKQFAVRAGYYTEHGTKGNRKFFTVGLGLKYNVFGLNFSYLVPTTNQRNPLDNTLRFSLLFDFGAFGQDGIEE